MKHTAGTAHNAILYAQHSTDSTIALIYGKHIKIGRSVMM
jgi:hypothetical protein